MTTQNQPGATRTAHTSAQPTNSTQTDNLTETSDVDAARKKAEALSGEAKTAARDAADSAQAEIHSQADRAKNTAASEVSNIASALQSAADDLRSGSATERGFARVADSLAGASDSLREKELGELVGDVNHFARENPGVFLGGAALLGFAISRFAKASNGESSLDRNSEQGGVAGYPASINDEYAPVTSTASDISNTGVA